ncbi:MAG: hypothetical protein K0R12_38 [Gammaproteobacteria bacterium]|jgi:hypothetical protein|nr:hypothetical protein [Gammaproteobacteria bacterium]
MSGSSSLNAEFMQQYKLIGRPHHGVVKVQDLKTGVCHRLPVNRLLQFPALMEAFTPEDRQRLSFLSEKSQKK